MRRTTPSPTQTRRPLTPPRTVESLWQPYVQKIAQHDRLQQCLATNCSGRLGNNQTNLLITIGDRTFGLCETTHLKDPSLAMEVEMILQAALNLVGVSNNSSSDSTNPCFASVIRSSEFRCTNRSDCSGGYGDNNHNGFVQSLPQTNPFDE